MKPLKEAQAATRISQARAEAITQDKDAVIDLSRPSTFYTSFEHRPSQMGLEGSFEASSIPRADISERLSVGERKTDMVNISRQIVQPAVGGRYVKENPGAEGLGLNWQTLMKPFDDTIGHSLGSHESHRSALNSAAPAFVPINSKPQMNNTSAFTQPPTDYGIRQTPTLIYSTGYPLMHEISTPPSTTSTQWSPVFSSANDTLDSVDPRVYSPQMDLDSHLNPLLALMQRMTAQERFDFIQDRLNTVGLPHPHSSYRLEGHKATLTSGPASRKPTAPIASSVNHGPGSELQNSTVYLRQKSEQPPEARRPPPYQQPRSIPLAKLIQRRLSSVTEEEITNFTNRLSQTGISEQKSRIPSSLSRSESEKSEAESLSSCNSTTPLNPCHGDENRLGMKPIAHNRSHQTNEAGTVLNASLGKENERNKAWAKQGRSQSQTKKRGRGGKNVSESHHSQGPI